MISRRKRGSSKADTENGILHLETSEEERDMSNDPSEEYILNCAKFDLKVDANVVIALKTRWEILKPTQQFNEGALLPLMGILDKDKTITKLNLSGVSMQDSRYRAAGNGNSNARVLRSILERNKYIQEIDLSNTGMSDEGIHELCDALKANKTLMKLNLSGNYFGEEATMLLNKALLENSSLKYLDISRNALDFSSINAIMCSCTKLGVVVRADGNYVFEEILNSVSHGFGFILSLIGAVLLMTEAAQRSDYHFWPCFLYSFSLCFLFLSSTLYHSFFMIPSVSRILQTLDHVAIYVLIAGSYSPYLLIGMHSSIGARVLACAVWIVAFGGSIFSAMSDLNNPFINAIECCIFLGLGFALVFIWNTFVTTLSPISMILLFTSGIFYAGGVTFYVLGNYRPVYHAIWHCCVLIAAVIQWFDIYFHIVTTTSMMTYVASMLYATAQAEINHSSATNNTSLS